MLIPHVHNWTIRKKLLVSMMVLGVVIAVLGYSSFRGVYAYRDLATTLSERAAEMPITSELTRSVDELRNEFPSFDLQSPLTFRLDQEFEISLQNERFSKKLDRVRMILSSYRTRLASFEEDDVLLADRSEEIELTERIAELLARIRDQQNAVMENGADYRTIRQLHDLKQLSELAHTLPTLLTKRMASFREEVRNRYRTWFGLTGGSAFLAVGLLIGLILYARLAVIRPFKELLVGARRVAAGDFTHRIEANRKDELAELANAINLGVESFLNIQRDLNEQVRERSREVIRNEQLASVGFLAAGVAHEINNPLASIAWSAEALESRLHRILYATPNNTTHNNTTADSSQPEGVDVETLKSYLRRIQDEAFRCKGITERLLDFSRLGNEEKRQYVDLSEVIEDVVEMVRHLGQFRTRKIVFNPGSTAMMAWASPQEMKQVILNLLTNALESLDPKSSEGVVSIEINQTNDHIVFSIEDNGSGMTEEVLTHLFEPFFTRRRDGRGTGLGLPITSRIIADHGGHISVKSLGPGVGSRFEVVVPNHPPEQTNYEYHSTPTSEYRNAA